MDTRDGWEEEKARGVDGPARGANAALRVGNSKFWRDIVG